MHYDQVGISRKRSPELGLASLEDEERSGPPQVYEQADLSLVRLLTEDPPEGATRQPRR